MKIMSITMITLSILCYAGNDELMPLNVSYQKLQQSYLQKKQNLEEEQQLYLQSNGKNKIINRSLLVGGFVGLATSLSSIMWINNPDVATSVIIPGAIISVASAAVGTWRGIQAETKENQMKRKLQDLEVGMQFVQQTTLKK